jgi:hypothetical protein
LPHQVCHARGRAALATEVAALATEVGALAEPVRRHRA